ncbi:xanthine dehydrogenase small subunit [Colwellia echini]|uniref:Xanthine dehydrogenase small subunit n=1 Tax=Colwellia echini TaxID=1982103 RepID=A0ABY3MZJ7_9GAMM|nr:xanthine dehydrogenase small subunit [Colwellia echini]TYK66643.1 xanthine dehydrogenase small subunit [Colwellia echini]
MIQFLFNGMPIKVEKCSPNRTTLDWLRTKKGKTGTKEGCATGDCGACTILVGEEVEHSGGKSVWQYKTMNSCLMLLGNVHGKHILTIEAVTTNIHAGLADLHPVQQAMVECHGSQCGFCTPGIIMSLLGLYINHKSYPGKKTVIEALGGNLCRCTGYQPILKAAEKAFEYERIAEPWSAMACRFSQQLIDETNKGKIPHLQDGERAFYIPQSAADVVALKAKHTTATFVAGATDFAIELNQQLRQPQTIISVSQVAEFISFTETASEFQIGAAVPYKEFTESLCQHYPEATELFERLGSMQVRNAGTLGGSLGNASPIGDPAPLLIALNAQMNLQSSQGTRVIDVEDFFIGYRKTSLKENEVISKIIIPKRSESLKLACHKISKRFEDDISTVCLILAVDHRNNVITSARCAFGGMAATPARAHKIEQQLLGGKINATTFIKAGEVVERDFSPLTDVRATADYRLAVSKNLLKRIGIEFSQASIARFSLATTTVPEAPSPISTRIRHASL